MTIRKQHVPEREMERLLALSSLDIDYGVHKENFNDLARLAAMIAGTKISLVNLIDSYTQWTISDYGFEMDAMDREDSACQYTIMGADYFEVEDMAADDRFKDKPYVIGDPMARYYFGVPLRVANGAAIGALCVLDQEYKALDGNKVALLKIVAGEIVNRLRTFQLLDALQAQVKDCERAIAKTAHDIRGPLSGIIGLSDIIVNQGGDNDIGEVLEYVGIIRDSGTSLLELASDLLKSSDPKSFANDQTVNGCSLSELKSALERLYQPQAMAKKIHLSLQISPDPEPLILPKGKLIQIAGNLIGNALKFTAEGGAIEASMVLLRGGGMRSMLINVTDDGVGITPEKLASIREGRATSTVGTIGEDGFGFGLALVQHIVNQLGGEFDVQSDEGRGARFRVTLPNAY